MTLALKQHPCPRADDNTGVKGLIHKLSRPPLRRPLRNGWILLIIGRETVELRPKLGSALCAKLGSALCAKLASALRAKVGSAVRVKLGLALRAKLARAVQQRLLERAPKAVAARTKGWRAADDGGRAGWKAGIGPLRR